MANEAIPYYRPGQNITGQASVAVIGKRCVMITGNMTSGPGLATTAEGSNVLIGPAAAAGRIFGVAAADAAIGKKVDVLRGAGNVVPITAAGAIAAFAEVEVGTAGQVVTKSAGVAIGYALTAAVNGGDAVISLY